jgi:tRNA threonylcarbamoyladenosine biosynthesis protein TsaE
VQVDTCHADLGKSGCRSPLAQLRDHGLTIEFTQTGHLTILGTRRLYWQNEAECAATAAALATRPALRDAYVELQGPLGAGKTTFARHLLHALGVPGRIKSPTYAVMEPYAPPGLPVWHFDFYRFDDPQEWEDAGFREVFASPGLKLAEWPEKAQGLVPEPDLRIRIEPRDDEQRTVNFDAHTSRGLEMLA